MPSVRKAACCKGCILYQVVVRLRGHHFVLGLVGRFLVGDFVVC